jgi:two-component system, cell cycle sensor histidine kinase and response regulator CckA
MMDRMDHISSEIDAVYQRALLIQQRATEIPVQPDLVDEALTELLFVLEELRVSQVELRRQNQDLVIAQLAADLGRQRYQALFELAPDSYLVTDQQGKIYNANRAAEKLFAIPQEYLINKPLMVLINESDQWEFHNRLLNIAVVEPSIPEYHQEWEVLLHPHNGETRSAAIAVTKFTEEPMEDSALLWLFRDITWRNKIVVASNAISASTIANNLFE